MKTLILSFIIGIQFHLGAQICGDSTAITLYTQADVDNFQMNHGPCDSVMVRLQIGGYGAATNITDLTPLQDVKWVNWLWVIDNHDLTTLEGLENIKRNGAGKLTIQLNDMLTDITALRGFGPEVGDLAIADNLSLENLDGLDSIRSAGTAVKIRNNPKLTDISALERLTAISREFEITKCINLTDIGPLSTFKDFAEGIPPNAINGARFSLHGNTLLRDCSPLCHIIQDDLKRLRDMNSIQIDSIDHNYLECLDEAAIMTHGLCCPDTLIVDASPIEMGNYTASMLISSDGAIQNTDTIHFISPSVELYPSFNVDQGGVLKTINDNCNNN